METNEIMTNAEDIMDVTEEVATCGGSKTLKIAGVVTGATLIGVVAYKYAIKPLWAKLKAKHEAKKASKEAVYVESKTDEFEEFNDWEDKIK
nr:MAG TPA: hypothetical protein [Caudoviricetes sp.]